MPRKAVELPEDQIRELAKIGCTQEEVGHIFGLTRSAVSRRLSREPLQSAWSRGQAEGCASLRRRLYEMAMSNSVVAAIFVAKNRWAWPRRSISR